MCVYTTMNQNSTVNDSSGSKPTKEALQLDGYQTPGPSRQTSTGFLASTFDDFPWLLDWEIICLPL